MKVVKLDGTYTHPRAQTHSHVAKATGSWRMIR